MARPSKKEAERKRQVATMRTLWTSLDSHLNLTIKESSPEERGAFGGSRKFHADTVREYAQSILDLAKNL